MHLTPFCGSREVGMGGWCMMRLDDAFQIKQVLQLGLAQTQNFLHLPAFASWLEYHILITYQIYCPQGGVVPP